MCSIRRTFFVVWRMNNPSQQTWEGYVRHYWDTQDMAYMRTKFCKTGTANSKCFAPPGGGKDYNNTLDWYVKAKNVLQHAVLFGARVVILSA
jgi:hypothetical protein